jgi:pimeloyl-ACP methyl ester carboxylesterase
VSSTPPTPTSPKKWTRRELHVRGVRLSYIERETPDPTSAAPILMLHGLIAGGDCFRRLANQLPNQRRIVALDLPGGGYSDRPETHDATFRAIAELVADTIPALGMDRPVLIGHSYGGAIALQLAAHRPDLINSMILIAPAHPFSRHQDLLIRFYLTLPGRLFAHLLPRVPRRVLLEGLRNTAGRRRNLQYEHIESYVQTLRYPGTVPYTLGILKSWRHDMRKLAQALASHPTDVPALLIWGDRDPVVPAFTAPELMRHLAHSEQVTLPGVGHLPNDERPDQCASLIRTWLERHAAIGTRT